MSEIENTEKEKEINQKEISETWDILKRLSIIVIFTLLMCLLIGIIEFGLTH